VYPCSPSVISPTSGTNHLLIRQSSAHSLSLTSQSPSSTLPTSPTIFSTLATGPFGFALLRVLDDAIAPGPDANGATGVGTLSAFPCPAGETVREVGLELDPARISAIDPEVDLWPVEVPHEGLGADRAGEELAVVVVRRLAKPPRFFTPAGGQTADKRGDGMRVSILRRIMTERFGS
jgi:hypothetical protein